MEPDAIAQEILGRFPGVVAKQAWGERSFFYNPGGVLPTGTYFLTLKSQDGPHDRASQLDRPEVFRVSFGSRRARFLELFGVVPARPAKGGVIGGPYDFTALDVLMPHPVYGWAYWLCVLNPSAATWSAVQPLIADYFAEAQRRFARRVKA